MYTGREYDRWLKLYYNRARYYNPQLARFISRDPIDIADDVNLYSYVGNNSMKYVDRNWLAAKTLIIWFRWWNADPAYYTDEDFQKDSFESWVVSIINKINDKKNKNIDTLMLTSAAFSSDTIAYAEDYIVNNKKDYNKIVILWHSMWWDNAVTLSNRLDWKEIDVDLLVTIDIAWIYDTDNIDSNVINAYNFYQTNDAVFIEWWEEIEKSYFNSRSNISNTDLSSYYYNNTKIKHTNIDNALEEIIYNLIIESNE